MLSLPGVSCEPSPATTVRGGLSKGIDPLRVSEGMTGVSTEWGLRDHLVHSPDFIGK